VPQVCPKLHDSSEWPCATQNFHSENTLHLTLIPITLSIYHIFLFPQGQSGHLQPGLRMSGATPPFPPVCLHAMHMDNFIITIFLLQININVQSSLKWLN
jgi:hypothetical protein